MAELPSPPTTPCKRKIRHESDEADDWNEDAQSPTKKPRTPLTPATPSKTALKRQEVAQRKAWKEDWTEWVVESKWTKDSSYRQKEGSYEIHRTTARDFYLLTGEEMDTLPYWEFENAYNPDIPGKAYPHEGVKMLVSRKYAMLAGLHKKDDEEKDMLRKGYALFSTAQNARRLKKPNLPSEPYTIRISPRKTTTSSLVPELGLLTHTPGASWWTPVSLDGQVVDHHLTQQFTTEYEEGGEDSY